MVKFFPLCLFLHNEWTRKAGSLKNDEYPNILLYIVHLFPWSRLSWNSTQHNSYSLYFWILYNCISMESLTCWEGSKEDEKWKMCSRWIYVRISLDFILRAKTYFFESTKFFWDILVARRLMEEVFALGAEL